MVHSPRPKRGSIPREIQSGPKDVTSKRTELRSQHSAQAQKAGQGNPVIQFFFFFFQNFSKFFSSSFSGSWEGTRSEGPSEGVLEDISKCIREGISEGISVFQKGLSQSLNQDPVWFRQPVGGMPWPVREVSFSFFFFFTDQHAEYQAGS